MLFNFGASSDLVKKLLDTSIYLLFLVYISCVLSHSVVSDSLSPRGLQPAGILCSWKFSRQDYWSGLPCTPSGDLPNQGIEPRSPALQVDSLACEPPGKSYMYVRKYMYFYIYKLFMCIYVCKSYIQIYNANLLLTRKHIHIVQNSKRIPFFSRKIYLPLLVFSHPEPTNLTNLFHNLLQMLYVYTRNTYTSIYLCIYIYLYIHTQGSFFFLLYIQDNMV